MKLVINGKLFLRRCVERVRVGDVDAGDKIIPKEFFNNLLGFVVGKCQVIRLSRSLCGRYPEGVDR